MSVQEFGIRWERCIHNSGTKYYQTIVIFTSDGPAVTYFNHGKYTNGARLVPKQHGKLDFAKVCFGLENAFRVADVKRRQKEKRGYENWESATSHYATKAEFEAALNDCFMKAQVEEIRSHLQYENPLRTPKGIVIASDTAEADAMNWGTW